MTKHGAVCGLLAGILLVSGGDSRADSLSDKISRQLNPALAINIPNLGTVPVNPAADFLVPIIQRLAIQGADFPSTSTTPGATFVYNPQLGVFERSSSLGPVFVERAGTIGANRAEVGLSYLYANVDEIDGGSFGTYAGTSTVFCQQQLAPDGTCPAGAVGVVNNTLTMEKFNLRYSVWNLSGTYGITDRWDVNVFLPLIYTKLSARERVNSRAFDVNSGASLGTGQATLSVSGSHFGVGDLLLRTKYRFLDEPLGMAAEMILRLPTGSVDNFQGLGDVVLTPALIMSRAFGPWDLHMNLGMAFNTDDLERTRGRYDVGVSYQVIEQLALLFDFVGSSGLDDDTFTVAGIGTPPRGVKVISSSGNSLNGSRQVAVPRGDNLNVVPGLKFSIGERVVAFAEAIVPVNTDGLRANVLPTAGVEIAF